MYKPFITCDNPKGVVECGSIRKYRCSSKKMKGRNKSKCPAENLEVQTSMKGKPDKEERVSKGSTDRSFDPTSLQLMEVSKGARRLNNMIGSWSTGLSYDEQSEDIAKDLLKGALDLQESLVMLHKVQEVSQHLSRLKRRQNEKSERVRIDDRMMNDRTYSNQFSEQSYPMGFQRPWSSADGSSTSCTEELKKVVKETLVRQNVFPRTATEVLDSASEFLSTNSSRSFGVQTERLSDSSFSPPTSRKERGPSLVARLMGLEEAPARSFPNLVPKQLESQKIQNHKRPMFEIDLPKVRKNNSIAEKVNPEGYKTVREILGTTHYSGLLKTSPVREPKFQVHHHFNDLHSKQFGDLPPIVLMKPRYDSYQEFAPIHEPVPPEELSLRKLKAKAVPSKTFKPREDYINMGKEMEECVSNRLTKEERTKCVKEVVELDAKEINPVENVRGSRGKVKLYSHASQKLQPRVSEIVDKKVKLKTISRNLPEKANWEPKIVIKSQDQGEICPTKLRKPQSGSRIDKNEIPSRKNIGSKTTSKPKNQKINIPKEPIKNQMKKQRHVAVPQATKPVAEQLGEEEKIIHVSCEDDCTEIRIITTIADDLTKEHEVDASATNIGDCKQSQSSSGDEILMLKPGHESDAIPAEEFHDSTNCCENEIDNKPDEEGSELKYLLLTNQSFIVHAEELLNLDLDSPKMQQKNETTEIANARLYLDCANELTERKSFQESQVVCSLLPTYAGNSRLHISLGKLVEEIYNTIENLTSYSEKNSGKKHASSDSIYTMMERDMKCNDGVMNGIWNWGWKHGFSADEAEQVVNEVENLVLSGLIEEVVVNL
ncbi:PREDICTED: uncharacterized protein LOC109342991 isoform X2 [Lupinus angustifolius]|uniref:uncharacterized protein LOC109342991 isoform X2 n=1 Tax=Lupinus angustifolius TaxID=3871 RepID=UPI00092FA8EB|nr:PREDICTED: uncharacterized protein LOC109342991 isoform X2 [Lupinus angustifolius]